MKVLVVDDERVIADTLGLILNRHGFETTVAYSGEGALEIANTSKPDCLLSDIIMGEMNGIDLAIEVTKVNPKCKIILCSGQEASAELLDAAEAKGYRFEILAKPFHPLVVVQNLASLAASTSSIDVEIDLD